MDFDILKSLNEEQRKPAEIVEGAILVTAGAGSGKTRMLTHRIAHLISDLGVRPQNILAITFTNKAANEMKTRIERLVPSLEGQTGNLWISTFHAMCAKILRQNIDLMGYSKSFSIYGDTEKNRVVKRITEELKTDINAETFGWHISNAKNNLMDPETYSKYIHDPKKCQIITRAYIMYEDELKRANALDFDDLIMKTYVLFKTNPDTLEYYQDKFKYIFVDEFQDTNTAQYELVKMLADKHKNILVVGDEDQCIYSWRGAEVENVKRFTVDFAGCKIFKLEQNYRSTKKIINLANKLIKHNADRIEKTLWTANSDGEEIELKQTYNDIEEAEQIAEKIEQMVSCGSKYSDFAILMRVNSLSRILEEKLLTYNIPYKIYGGFKFFERKEIKDTTAYLYLVVNPNDTEATSRMLSFPKKGIGEVSIGLIHSLAAENGVSEMEIILNAEKYGISGALLTKLAAVRDLYNDLLVKKEELPLVEFASYVVKQVGIKDAIGNKTEDDINKCMNVDDLIKSVTEFAASNPDSTLEDFLSSITLMRDIDQMSDDDDFVSLLTIHSAKGLEFKNVFIVGVNDGLFPLSRAINSTDPNELEEERRLMYVAITRAKERLFISRPKVKLNFESKRTEYTMPSRFLLEMFDELKQKSYSGNAYRTNLSESGFDSYISSEEKKQSLDEFMSSHANVVNVSKSTPANNTQSKNAKIPTSDYSKFKTGTRVRHPHFGEGEVTVGVSDFASAFVTIKFDSVGIKTLSLKYASLEIID